MPKSAEIRTAAPLTALTIAPLEPLVGAGALPPVEPEEALEPVVLAPLDAADAPEVDPGRSKP